MLSEPSYEKILQYQPRLQQTAAPGKQLFERPFPAHKHRAKPLQIPDLKKVYEIVQMFNIVLKHLIWG